jgi:hypothetical protein
MFPKKLEDVKDVKNFINDSRKADVVFREAISQNPIEVDVKRENQKRISLSDKIESILGKTLSKHGYLIPSDIVLEIKDLIKKDHPELTISMKQIDYIIDKVRKMNYDYQEKFNEDLSFDEDDLKNLILENKKGYIYNFSYSDNDGGFWADMEHGGTFDNLPHLEESRH